MNVQFVFARASFARTLLLRKSGDEIVYLMGNMYS